MKWSIRGGIEVNRNLILIHLESLSNIIYRMNPFLFQNIRSVERESISCQKFFSSATSTLMVLGDMYYGGMEQYESCLSLDYIPEKYHYEKSLFDDLKEKGYRTGLFIYPDGGGLESAEKRHIAGFQNEMILKKTYGEYIDAIRNIVGEQPFALSLCNYISNMGFSRYVDLNNDLPGNVRWKIGYKELDKSVGDIFNILRDKGVLNQTTVILYGDHGDDYWMHGLHEGCCHSIEPYTELIHTPLMIYDKRFAAEINSSLLGTTDIRNLINGLLCENNADNLMFPQRSFAISRTAYAAQPLRNESLKKAYSITEGKLLLLVSNEGMEMYDVEIDPTCGNNLLNIFLYSEGVLYLDESKKGVKSRHYALFMNSGHIRLIRQNFYHLRVKLYKEVKMLYEAAGISEEKMEKEMKYDKIRYTSFGTVNNGEE